MIAFFPRKQRGITPLKYLAALAMFLSLQGGVCEAQRTLPPADSIGQIADLEGRKFFDETVTIFAGWDIPFDGGSKVFFFATSSGLSFYVIAANKHYWNEKDKKTRLQPYFIQVGGKFYRIEPKSDEEAKLLAMLEKGLPSFNGTERASPEIAKLLIEHIRSRRFVVPPP